MFGYPALSPIGKAVYANAAIMVSAIINVIACMILWATDNISVLSVSIVLVPRILWCSLLDSVHS